ncbi:unnamed protein product [Caenorhabditis brenneri]
MSINVGNRRKFQLAEVNFVDFPALQKLVGITAESTIDQNRIFYGCQWNLSKTARSIKKWKFCYKQREQMKIIDRGAHLYDADGYF